MPSKRLTATAIPHLPEGEWYDAVLPGLIIRVGRRRRVWSFRYRAGGSYRRAALGTFPNVELAEARDAARRLIERIDSGAQPLPPAPHPRSVDVLTLGRLIDDYEAMRAQEGSKVKTLTKSMRSLRRNLKSYLTLPAATFAKSDLRNVRNELLAAGTPAAANRFLGSLGPLMQWASAEDLVESNFVPAIRRTQLAARERVLTEAEVKAIWRACEEFEDGVAASYGRLVRFLLVTAQRLGEGAGLRHGDILDGTWKQLTNKASRPHSLVLPALALSLLGQGRAHDYVFPGQNGEIGAFSKLKRRLDEASGVTGWRVHDLRRTAASSMQDLGIRHEIISAVLNHSLPGVAAVYLRAQLEEQKGEALATWANALVCIVGLHAEQRA